MSELERALGRVLSVGVALSTAALVAGLSVALVAGTSSPWAMRLLTVGVLILMGTPVARVVVSSVGYARRRDWLFVVLTLVVLGELIASIVAAVRSR